MGRLPLAAFALVLSAASVAGLSGIWDPDFYHHLAVGRALVRGTSFAEDPFLYSLAGQPSGVPPYWLGSLAIYAATLPGGVSGAVVLVAALAATLFALLLADALEGHSEPHRVLVAVALLALALPELRVRSAPRPELFGALFLAYFLLAVRRFEDGRPRLLLAAPLVALAWAQTHVSVAMGLGVLALHLLWSAGRVALARSRGAQAAWGELRTPSLVLAASALATMLPPASGGPLSLAWKFLLSTFGLGEARTDQGLGEVVDLFRQHIEELQAPSLLDWATRPFGLLVTLAALSFALHRSRGWGRELATVLAFGAFAASAYRFTALAAYVAAPIAARNLSGWLDRVRPRWPRAVAAAAALVACGGVALAASSPLLRAYRVGVGMVPGAFPVRAAEYLRSIGFEGRLYNDLGSGGYFEWTLDRPVFQDGRGFGVAGDFRDVLPEPVDPARMARLDARYRFDALAISTELPTGAEASLLEKLHGRRDRLADRRLWSLVAFDDRAALYLRRDGRYAAHAARDEYHVATPGMPLARGPRAAGHREQLAAELARAARESPTCVRCRTDLVEVLLDASRSTEAAPIIAELRALDHPGTRAMVEVFAATEAQRRGDLAAAEASYRAAIDAADDPTTHRRVFAYFLAGRGRLREADALVRLNLRKRRDVEDLDMAAELARRTGDAERATELGRELALARRRAFAAARVEDGIVLARTGREAEALGAFREAIAMDERSVAARTQLGFLLLAMGEHDAARAEVSRALRLDPEAAEAWLVLAQALDGRGEARGAADAYGRYLDLAPRGGNAAEARARLAALSAR